MSDFSERVSRRHAQMQSEAAKKAADDLALKQAADAAADKKEKERIAEIKKDMRYQRLVELSRSPQLSEALDYMAVEFKKRHPQSEVGPITYDENLGFIPNHPVGWMYVRRNFGHFQFSIRFTWRNEATKAIHHPAEAGLPFEGKSAALRRKAYTEGVDRKAGLAIEIDMFSNNYFYTLDELLEHLVEYVINGQPIDAGPATYEWGDW